MSCFSSACVRLTPSQVSSTAALVLFRDFNGLQVPFISSVEREASVADWECISSTRLLCGGSSRLGIRFKVLPLSD